MQINIEQIALIQNIFNTKLIKVPSGLNDHIINNSSCANLSRLCECRNYVQGLISTYLIKKKKKS